jgi:hypothetical protein
MAKPKARVSPGHPAPSTCWRWMRHGVLARNGSRVRLKHGRAGRRVFTTRDWLDEFFQAVAAADLAAFDAEAMGGETAGKRGN